MAWIKRNLFFVIGAAIAVGLLAAAGFYDYQSWQQNKNALNQLNETYATLQRLNSQPLLPGNDQVNNIQAARDQTQQLRNWIQRARQYFQPIPPVPNPTNGVITDSQFASARDHTLNQLQNEAADASVTLPPQYGFSFQAERPLVKFAPAGLAPLAQQLGEVKILCEILYSARVNSLDGIRRVPVSSDDAGGSGADYLSATAETNDLAVFTPYEITFRCFSQNLANVLAKFASSPHGFIVKAVNVQPAAGAASAPTAGGVPFAPPGQSSLGQASLGQQSLGATAFSRRSVAPLAPSGGAGGLQTVLDEQLLSVTLDVEIVKLLAGN